MTKYNCSLISISDAIDKMFEEALTLKVSSTSTSNYSTADLYSGQWNTYWTWPTITTIDIPKIDVPHYPVANGYIKEDGSLYFSFAVTGYDKSELTIKAEDNTFIVTGKLKEKTDTSKWKQLFNNIAIRDFEWKRRIPNKHDLEKLEAKVEKGILEIIIPLKEACKPIKKEFEIK